MVAYIPALIPAMPRWQNPLKGQPGWVGHPVLFLGNTAGPSPARFTTKPRGGESQQSKGNSIPLPVPCLLRPKRSGGILAGSSIYRVALRKQKAALPPLDPLQRSSRILRFPEPEGGRAAGKWGCSCTRFHRPASIRPATSQGWSDATARRQSQATGPKLETVRLSRGWTRPAPTVSYEVLGPSKRPQTPLGGTSAAHHAESEGKKKQTRARRLLCGFSSRRVCPGKPTAHLPAARRPRSRVTRSAELFWSFTPSPVPRGPQQQQQQQRLTPPYVTQAEPDANRALGSHWLA